MRKAVASVTVVLLIPVSVLALDYTDRSPMYADAPFTKAESVGISVLTNLDVLEGYPDRTFRAGQKINRAEFLKIALLTRGQTGGPARACFPDVKQTDWFSPFVCQAKTDNIVKGYTDGLFHPERPVTYAEAVKILVALYRYPVRAMPRGQWYEPYIEAADRRQILIPLPQDVQTYLPRGAMARLAAVFRADADGELDRYRAAEQGKVLPSSSSSSAASSSSSESSSSSVSSAPPASSSSSSTASASGSVSTSTHFPVRSHLLLLGAEGPAIAGATFSANLESLRVRGAEVKLKTKIKSFDALFLIDESGNKLGQLSLLSSDTTDKTWKGSFGTGSYVIPKGQGRTLGVIARLKAPASGGIPEELVHVDTLRISVEGVDSGSTFSSSPGDLIYPQHQTTQGRVTGVLNALADREPFVTGQDQILAAFSFRAEKVLSLDVALLDLNFSVGKPAGVAVSNWQLGAPDSTTRVSCSVADTTVSCSGIPATLGTIGGGARTLRLYGTVNLDQGMQNPYLQASLNDPGGPGLTGAIRWTDGAGSYTWTELGNPIVKGTLWK